MRQMYSIAAKKSKERKAKDKNRRDKGACLSDRVLVRNCTECGGTEKLRSYRENDIYKIVD